MVAGVEWFNQVFRLQEKNTASAPGLAIFETWVSGHHAESGNALLTNRLLPILHFAAPRRKGTLDYGSVYESDLEIAGHTRGAGTPFLPISFGLLQDNGCRTLVSSIPDATTMGVAFRR
jgi:hypothetical protein